MHKTPKHNGVGWGGRENAVKLGSQPGQLHSPVLGSGVCPATQASSSSGSRLTRPAINKALVCPKPMIFYVLLKCINARLVFYLAEEKSKMRNRGKRGGRRVGCIVCGRLTVPSYRCYCAVLLDQTFAWVTGTYPPTVLPFVAHCSGSNILLLPHVGLQRFIWWDIWWIVSIAMFTSWSLSSPGV